MKEKREHGERAVFGRETECLRFENDRGFGFSVVSFLVQYYMPLRRTQRGEVVRLCSSLLLPGGRRQHATWWTCDFSERNERSSVFGQAPRLCGRRPYPSTSSLRGICRFRYLVSGSLVPLSRELVRGTRPN